MDNFSDILGNIIGIGFGIFCIILLFSLCTYGNQVLSDKKPDVDDAKIDDFEELDDKTEDNNPTAQDGPTNQQNFCSVDGNESGDEAENHLVVPWGTSSFYCIYLSQPVSG